MAIKNQNPSKAIPIEPSWRKYQASNRGIARRKKWFHRSIAFTIALLLTVGVLLGIQKLDHRMPTAATLSRNQTNPAAAGKNPIPQPSPLLSQDVVRSMLKGESLMNLENPGFDVLHDGNAYHIETSLDMALQNRLLDELNQSIAKPRYRSRYVGIVVMDAASGKILAMVGYDKENPSRNTCLANIFPAASIFKIVTAAAAIEERKFNANTVFEFNGRKHTLYKSQLKTRKNRYTSRITLRNSFAQSVNPVFGKIGALHLGKPLLEQYASAFGFNRELNFDLPLAVSHMSVSDEPYELAEIASGFNHDTTISPLHGALMVSAILNQGKPPQPFFVNRIENKKGVLSFEGKTKLMQRFIAPETATELFDMMRTTVSSGTAKKSFRKYRKNKTLSRLQIGGKTGSINNNPRYDWFVGFAQDETSGTKLSLAAVVAHEKYIGKRAMTYVRVAIETYFDRYFVMAKNQKTNFDHTRTKQQSDIYAVQKKG